MLPPAMARAPEATMAVLAEFRLSQEEELSALLPLDYWWMAEEARATRWSLDSIMESWLD